MERIDAVDSRVQKDLKQKGKVEDGGSAAASSWSSEQPRSLQSNLDFVGRPDTLPR